LTAPQKQQWQQRRQQRRYLRQNKRDKMGEGGFIGMSLFCDFTSGVLGGYRRRCLATSGTYT
jgi:hypothetical protein